MNKSTGIPCWRVFALLILIQLLAGCAATPTVPLSALSYRVDEGAPQRNLLVLLRGFGADNTVFAEEGLVEAIRQRGLPFDVIAPDAHFGYYRTQTFEARLKEDIIDPARRQGYRQIWLAGFSMGGLGCLIYQRRYPGDIDGILLTSPFLGWSAIHEEIRDAGGLADWQPGIGDAADWERMIWGWIKSHDFSAEPPIWLGYGANDLLTAAGPPMLAAVMPEARVFTIPGNHTLSTFKTIFLRHLDTLSRQDVVLTGRQVMGPAPEAAAR